MEFVWYLVNGTVWLLLGVVATWGYFRYRLSKIKRHAPSAEGVGLHVALTQEEYDQLPVKEENTLYIIRPDKKG